MQYEGSGFLPPSGKLFAGDRLTNPELNELYQ
jgi:hypothetical protein